MSETGRKGRKGARVKLSKDNKRSVVDGPFTETKELVAGFWIWKCKSLDEAIGWAKRSPSPFPGQECEIEVRQIFEARTSAPSSPPRSAPGKSACG